MRLEPQIFKCLSTLRRDGASIAKSGNHLPHRPFETPVGDNIDAENEEYQEKTDHQDVLCIHSVDSLHDGFTKDNSVSGAR